MLLHHFVANQWSGGSLIVPVLCSLYGSRFELNYHFKIHFSKRWVLSHVRALPESFPTTTFNRIYREYNTDADLLSKKRSGLQESIIHFK